MLNGSNNGSIVPLLRSATLTNGMVESLEILLGSSLIRGEAIRLNGILIPFYNSQTSECVVQRQIRQRRLGVDLWYLVFSDRLKRHFERRRVGCFGRTKRCERRYSQKNKAEPER